MSSEKLTLKLEERTVTGKKVAVLRKDGIVPGTVYGSGFDAINVAAPVITLEKLYRSAGKHHPVHLTIGTKRKIAMIKNVSFDPVKRSLRHISFHAVKQNEAVEAEIPIMLTGEGESEAEKAGLVVLQTLETVAVKAFPMDLPDRLDVSIEHLAEPGQHVTMADVTLPGGVEFADAEAVAELVIASVYEPSALQAANEKAAGDAELGDEAEVDSEHGEDTDQEQSQDPEDRPGGKLQDEPKQKNVDANPGTHNA